MVWSESSPGEHKRRGTLGYGTRRTGRAVPLSEFAGRRERGDAGGYVVGACVCRRRTLVGAGRGDYEGGEVGGDAEDLARVAVEHGVGQAFVGALVDEEDLDDLGEGCGCCGR